MAEEGRLHDYLVYQDWIEAMAEKGRLQASKYLVFQVCVAAMAEEVRLRQLIT